MTNASAENSENEPLQLQYLDILRSAECPSGDDSEQVQALARATMERADENLAFLYFLIEVCEFSYAEFDIVELDYWRKVNEVDRQDPVPVYFIQLVLMHRFLTDTTPESQDDKQWYLSMLRLGTDAGEVPAQLLAAWLYAEEQANNSQIEQSQRTAYFRQIASSFGMLRYSDISREFGTLLADYLERNPGPANEELPDWYVKNLNNPEIQSQVLTGSPYEYCWDGADFDACSRAAFIDHFTCLWSDAGGAAGSAQYLQCRDTRLND
ncbi:MAG: hypothetical protein RIM33_17695 [Alphaproteobacteria bacterium]